MKNYIVILLLMLTSYATGRYMSPEKIRTEVKTVTVEKVIVKKEHKQIKIHQNTDGSKDTVILVDSDVQQRSDTKSKAEEKEIVFKENKTNVSLLIGGTYPLSTLNFGLSFQRNMLGPITGGTWVLNTNGGFAGGLSVGLNF